MSKTGKTTPMMEQYLAIKAKYNDAVLFFRMGDFYEMFYDDAKIASKVLGLALTSRAHGKTAEVPLAGFPYHSLDTYLTKMIQAGYRVAVCEQLEDPKQAKTVVKRDVTEVVTPGTALTDDLLDSHRNNFLVAVYLQGEVGGLAVVDISTGEFSVGEVPLESFVDEVLKLAPSELLVSEEQAGFIQERWPRAEQVFMTRREAWVFTRDYGYEVLTKHFNTLSLKGFGCDDLEAGICAAGAVLHYLKENQKSELGHIRRLQRLSNTEFVGLDQATRRNLELLRSIRDGTTHGTLISVLDRTRTPMGARKLVQWVLHPLRDPDRIRARLDAVEELVQTKTTLERLREALGEFGDLERLMAKVTTGRANARDLKAVANSLRHVPALKEILKEAESQFLSRIRNDLNTLDALVQEIDSALVDEPPLAITEGGLIRRGYNPELDELRDIAYSGKDWIARLQKTERERTGIPSLKVSYNKVFGYYIEVTKPHLSKVPDHYIRKQTLVNAERFVTPELKAYEEKVLDAEEKIVTLEYELFGRLRSRVAEQAGDVQENARLIAALDCLSNFAQLAIDYRYARPEINNGTAIVIQEGRHPVVERLLPYGESFVPNDTLIDNRKEQVLILTGPNMAGKSTYLRQVGLIVLMAQMGSFVPAKGAKIGVVDKVFTRVGASDNLAGGESTFLVEMNETANILNNATDRSLILLDEIGRGTSTFDGLSIAWAVAEYIHNASHVAAKCIFATHYHELTELALVLPRVKNYNVAVKEWGDQVVFLRRIEEGGCDHSYGIHVAQLAGLPPQVIQRAREILSNLESNELTPNRMPKLAARSKNGLHEKPQQLDIFSQQEGGLRQKLQELTIDEMTPLQALIKLDELKKLVRES